LIASVVAAFCRASRIERLCGSARISYVDIGAPE
jgi:hypothetical protein